MIIIPSFSTFSVDDSHQPIGVLVAQRLSRHSVSTFLPEMDVTKFTEEFTPAVMEKMFAARTALKDYVLSNARPGDIQSVIDTIDKFGWNQQWLMNIGDRKGLILDRAIQARQPKSVLELGTLDRILSLDASLHSCFTGTFLGYSSLRMLVHLPVDALLVSIESDSQSVEIARCIHQFAGVTGRVHIVEGYTDRVIPQLSTIFHVDAFDLVFIDHYKEVYLRDLKLLEDLQLIKPGTMIVTDNVIYPGAPDYLAYVRSHPNYTSTFHEGTIEYREDLTDGVEISVRT